MLCQFTVKNYKSIKDELTLDMQATAISEHVEQIIKDKDGEQFLPLAAIYGPNGGGKSNVLEALHTLIAKVLRPICATCDNTDCSYKAPKLPITPFAFSEESRTTPTEFELFFRTTASEYRYKLTVLKDVVLYESLDKKNIESSRYASLFERDKAKENEIELKGVFKRFKAIEISETLPLLSYLAITYKKNSVVNDVTRWFEDEIDFLNYGNPLEELKMAIARSGKVKELILGMVKEMDLDISDFRIEQQDDQPLKVFTVHTVNDSSIELNLNDESSGTRKIFGLLPFIARSIISGTTMVIDELDAKIHPQLLRYIIELYRDSEINRHGAQLIFTSHDLSTMSGELFRRDEIWFVAKGKLENSKLYSLVEFKVDGKSVRKDAKFDKQYLEGKYGADPYLQKIINWEDLDGES